MFSVHEKFPVWEKSYRFTFNSYRTLTLLYINDAIVEITFIQFTHYRISVG